jgi:hypothetical protein
MSIDSALALAKRLKRERQARDLAPVILIVGDPEPARLGYDLSSERMALIECNGGAEVFEAGPMESTRAFHDRLVTVARARGERIVSLGSDTPQPPSRFDAEGKLIVMN